MAGLTWRPALVGCRLCPWWAFAMPPLRRHYSQEHPGQEPPPLTVALFRQAAAHDEREAADGR